MKRVATAATPWSLAAAVSIALGLGAGSSWAGPVTTGEQELQAPGTEAAATGPGSMATGGHGGSPAGPTPATPTRPNAGSAGAADPTSASSQLAAEILREAGVGVAASAADSGRPPGGPRQQAGPRPGSPANPSGGAAPGGQPDDEALRDVKDFGKAAIAWLKGTVPWLQSDDLEADVAGGHADGSIAWSGAAGGPGSPDGRLPAGSSTGPLNAATAAGGYLDGTPRSSRPQDYERNLVREAVAMVKEVLAHPMTWLIIAIFAIGGVAMSLADRRPK